MSNPLLAASNIHKSYIIGREPLIVLRGASIAVKRGDFLAVSGASGSGKSTLLHILGALDVPDDGRVVLNGTDLFALPQAGREDVRCRGVGFVFQFYHLLPELNLLENTLLPRMVDSSIGGWFANRAAARRAAEEILDRVGLSHRLRHRPNELSGGERQRAAIARALVNEPELLLADEPTGNLDARTGDTILELLRELNEQGQAIVMVTHDARTAAYAKRNVLLEEGRIKTA